MSLTNEQNEYIERLEKIAFSRLSDAPFREKMLQYASNSSDLPPNYLTETTIFRECDLPIYVIKHSDIFIGKDSENLVHSHDFFELNFVCKGTFTQYLENKTVQQDQSSILLMNPWARHNVYTYDKESVLINFLIRKRTVEDIFIRLLSAHSSITHFFLDSIYGSDHKVNYMFYKNTKGVSEHAWNMIRIFLGSDLFKSEQLLAETLLLFTEMLKTIEAPDPTEHHRRSTSDMLVYLQNHYNTATLQSVADSFHYSPSYVSTAFKQEFGRSFSVLRTEYRMQAAGNYIKNSDISTEMIAEIIGYKDMKNFYRVFKQYYNMTPKEYREKNRRDDL